MMSTDINIHTGHLWKCDCGNCRNKVNLRYVPMKNDNQHVWGTYKVNEKERERKMKLSNVMNVWDRLHIKDTGDIGFSDLEKAIKETVGITNNIPQEQPKEPVPSVPMPKVKPPREPDQALLGMATCEELLKELSARIEIHGPGLGYRTFTVDGD